MSFTLLIHRNIEVWLADTENQIIPHGEVKMQGNTISTSVSFPKGMHYAVHWRNHPGTAHTVFCEIFIHGKKTRVATHFMDKDKPETQTRSSLGRINPLITGNQNNDWLTAPAPSKHAHVELHIRRAKGTPIHECIPNPADPAGHLDEIDIDLVDDPGEDQDPFIIFRFEFVPAPKPERYMNSVAGPSKSTVPQKRKQPTGRHFSPSRSTRRVQDKRRQDSPDDPVGRASSPLADGPRNSARSQDDLLDRLNAAREEEKKLDAELEAELQAIQKEDSGEEEGSRKMSLCGAFPA
ncbi:hypothetical protein MVEN_01065200 [Mycena venus]|uniref:Uncharacterized protein n=1 Tax=Mycena venus TaxID=2733690 RepID=A0A8H6Y8G6_9AGAR|nr:hypothetical protein MVEN_01065200 [Mycena venus]